MRPFLETPRLALRRFTVGDVDSLVALDSDPEVMRYLSGGPATPRETIEQEILPRFVASYQEYGGLGYWAALAQSDGEFLGWFALLPFVGGAPGELELGYRLHRAVWGRGLASEGARALIDRAFTEFGAHRVIARTYSDNLASRRVMEKAGMAFVRSFRINSPGELAGTFATEGVELFPGDDVEYAVERADSARQRLGSNP